MKHDDRPRWYHLGTAWSRIPILRWLILRPWYVGMAGSRVYKNILTGMPVVR